jgi:hypothetical protein
MSSIIQGEQAQPAGVMDGLLLGMIALFGRTVRQVMDEYEQVEKCRDGKQQKSERYILERFFDLDCRAAGEAASI